MYHHGTLEKYTVTYSIVLVVYCCEVFYMRHLVDSLVSSILAVYLYARTYLQGNVGLSGVWHEILRSTIVVQPGIWSKQAYRIYRYDKPKEPMVIIPVDTICLLGPYARLDHYSRPKYM
jgi:hypothetical protein